MFGIFSKTTDSNFIEASGLAGLDFIILDQEHGPATEDILQNHVRASKLAGLTSIIRVPCNMPYMIGSALDTGADGVQIPNISTYEQALSAVNAARFYPKGMRGVCRFVNAANYGLKQKSEYFTEENNKKVVLQVEGTDGINSLNEILKIPDFDVLFIGPYDLSQSAGFPGDVNHPKVIALINEIIEKVKKSGKVLGTFTDEIDAIDKLKTQGFDYIAYSVDVAIYANSLNNIVKKFYGK